MTENPFTLRVEFMGVCGFVPDEPLFVRTDQSVKVGNPKRIDVLLPDMKNPTTAHWELNAKLPDTHIRRSHWPVLLFDLANLLTSGLPPKAIFTDPVNGRTRWAHVLTKEVVSIDLQDSPISFENTLPNPLDLECPAPGASDLRKSLWWLPQMAEISTSHAYARKELLTNPLPSGVAGRFEIRGGHLSVVSLNEADDCSWDFRSVYRDGANRLQFPDPPTWRRAIGNVVALERTIDSDFVKIKVTSDTTHEITLKPASEGGVVTVGIANVEPETLFSGDEPPLIPLNAKVDADFEGIYSLALPSGSPLRLPYKEGGMSGAKEKPCAPGSFLGAR